MTIYEELVQRVDRGERFYIDLKTQTMKVGKHKLIDGGEYDKARSLINISTDDVLVNIEALYKRYKYSMPSERSDSKYRKYFKALSVDELSDAEMATGDKREVARARLEGYILCAVLDGKFVWDESKMGKWFYQSVEDPDFVILRDWVENK